MTLLKFSDVSLAYGAMPLLDGVSWQIARGERVCIIGRNGTGKSRMLRLVKGEQMPDDGVIWRAPALKIGAPGSELIAMIFFDSFMPATCWIEPEMPQAM